MSESGAESDGRYIAMFPKAARDDVLRRRLNLGDTRHNRRRRVQLSVPLDAKLVFLLQAFAEHAGLSRRALAAELLEQAVLSAINDIETKATYLESDRVLAESLAASVRGLEAAALREAQPK